MAYSLEGVFTAEILPIGVLDPSIHKRLVTLVVNLFQQDTPEHFASFGDKTKVFLQCFFA
jgi:hypothetical protein